MRTLKNLGYPQDNDTFNFPDGQIVNETATQEGTPVTRELYGDVLANVYAILRDAGIDANELEDNESRGYQFLKALKTFANELNDLNQPITVGQSTMQVDFNFDDLPVNYVFLGKLNSDVKKDVTYDFVGTGNKIFNFTASQDARSNTQVIVTLKNNEAEIALITGIDESEPLITPFDGVLSFNSTNKIYYLIDGYLLSNVPESFNIQQAIRVDQGDNTIMVHDAIVHKDKLIVMAKPSANVTYDFYYLDLESATIGVVKMTYAQGTTDQQPTLYADGTYLYLSNDGNKSANENELAQIQFDEVANTLNDVSTITLDIQFTKTQNAFVRDTSIYTLVGGNINEYKFDGTTIFKGYFPTISGVMFNQKGQIYYTSGELGIPWNI